MRWVWPITWEERLVAGWSVGLDDLDSVDGVDGARQCQREIEDDQYGAPEDHRFLGSGHGLLGALKPLGEGVVVYISDRGDRGGRSRLRRP